MSGKCAKWYFILSRVVSVRLGSSSWGNQDSRKGVQNKSDFFFIFVLLSENAFLLAVLDPLDPEHFGFSKKSSKTCKRKLYTPKLEIFHFLKRKIVKIFFFSKWLKKTLLCLCFKIFLVFIVIKGLCFIISLLDRCWSLYIKR